MATLRLPDGRTVTVTDGMTIGRVAGCDVVLDDEKVSRKHARVVMRSGVAEVEDLGSRNGVFLNGNRVLRRVLRDGDVLTVGRVDMAFEDAAARVAASPAPGQDLLAGEDLPSTAPDPETARSLAPRVPRAPRAPEPVARVDEVEVLEFVDEVVEVRRRPEPAPSPRAASGAPRASARGDARGVLQFSKQGSAGVMGEDVGQLGGLRRLGIVVLGVAITAGAAWVAMTLVS